MEYLMDDLDDKKKKLSLFDAIGANEEYTDWLRENEGNESDSAFAYKIWNKRPGLKSKLILCTYDVSKTRLRNFVIRCLKKSGMHRVQKSVFIGEISERAFKTLKAELKGRENEFEEQDHIMLIPCTEDQLMNIHITGHALDFAYLLNRKRVLTPGMGK